MSPESSSPEPLSFTTRPPSHKLMSQYVVYMDVASAALASNSSLYTTFASAQASSKSDIIPARSFALLTHRLPSSQPLAYIIAQLRLACFAIITFKLCEVFKKLFMYSRSLQFLQKLHWPTF